VVEFFIIHLIRLASLSTFPSQGKAFTHHELYRLLTPHPPPFGGPPSPPRGRLAHTTSCIGYWHLIRHRSAGEVGQFSCHSERSEESFRYIPLERFFVALLLRMTLAGEFASPFSPRGGGLRTQTDSGTPLWFLAACPAPSDEGAGERQRD
jgi:hypothetical protein